MNILIYLKKEMVSLLIFAKKPVYKKSKESFYNKLLVLITILIINVLIIVPLYECLLYLLSKLGYEEVLNSHLIYDLFKSHSPFIVGLLIIVVIPPIEELVFRLQLKYRKWVLDILIPLQISAVLYAISFLVNININFLIIISLCYVAYFLYKKRYPNKIQKIWKKQFPFVFYTLTILFALVHITNFEFTNSIVLITPILVLPQFITGIIIGYFRVKFGFFWGVLYHIIFNAVVIIPFIFSLPNNSQKLSVDNENFKLTISENSLFNKNNTVLHNSVDSYLYL